NHIIDSVNVVDEYEIEINLQKPSGSFLQDLGLVSFGIMSPEAIEKFGPDIKENPVGTGPFKFVSWKKDETITLEKNEEYRVEELPKLDKLIFEVIPDNSARLIALKSGDIDIMDG